MSAPTKHTQGKWYPAQHFRRGGSLGPLKIENGVTVIAEITYREPEEMAANASLLAAAPDLLAALERIADGQWPTTIAETPGTLAMREVARTAIRKARGIVSC
jgi:hypothetical protein